MSYRKVTAIIRSEVLEKVETKLRQLGVHGMSICDVKGYGEYANFYSRDLMVNHTRIEIFIGEEDADGIAQAIMEAAHVGVEGDGIVAIIPVEKLFRIRTQCEVQSSNI